MLTYNQIKIEQARGGLFIEDFDEKRLNPNSYNLRLSDELLIYEDVVLDPRVECKTRPIKIPPEGLILEPFRLYLGRTLEWTETPNFIPLIDGRSSLGRYGLAVHVTAGFGDIGYKGTWTLEIWCIQPFVLVPGMEICQISYQQPYGEITKRYQGKYQGAKNVLASRLYTEMGGVNK